jgi:hypothetical protein
MFKYFRPGCRRVLNPSKMDLGFKARARPGLKYLNMFWAEKLVLVVIHQVLPRNVKINK